jgi:DnaJ like chaperone protein
MIWPSTVLGVGIGYAIAGIPGVLLGALLGQVLDRRLKLQSLADLRQRFTRTVDRNDLLFTMLGRIAKRDGVVRDAHIKQARAEMQRLRLDTVTQRRAIDAFSRGKTEDIKLHVPLRHIRADRETAVGMVSACWRMANADQRASTGTRELILLWGKWLGLSASDVLALDGQRRTASNSPALGEQARYAEAMRLLGVTRDTPVDAVKKAYRRGLSAHHPDKLAGQGASAERIREATDKTRTLQQAYQLVRQVRGFR